MSFEDFLSKLDPKDARSIQTAATRKVERLPLASRTLTDALNGGIGRGRITTIHGNYSAGKTLLTLQSIAMWQEMGLSVGFIDCEGTLDGDWASRLGVDIDRLVVDGSKSSQRVEQMAVKWINAGLDALVIDSISDILPETFVDEKTRQLDSRRVQIGAHAKAIGSLVNGIHYANDNTAVILLSQQTTQMAQTYVKQVPHGGNKILFGSSTIIKLTSSGTDAKQIKGLIRVGSVKEEKPIGRHVDALIEKNKAGGAQNRTASYDIYYDGDFVGIDAAGELVELIIDRGVINKAGAWLKMDDGRSWQGKQNLIEAIRNDKDLEREFENLLVSVNSEVEDDGGPEV